MSQPNLNCEVVNRESSGLEQLRGSQQSGGDRNGARSHPHPPPRGREHHRVGCGPRKRLPSDSPTWRSWFYKGSWPMPSKQFSPKSISQVVTWFYFKRRLCLRHNKTRAWLFSVGRFQNLEQAPFSERMWCTRFPSSLFYLCIYFWSRWAFIAVHGLSLVVASGGYFPVAVRAFLIAVASLISVHGL